MCGKDMRRLLKLVCSAFLNPGGFQRQANNFILIQFEVRIPWDVLNFYNIHVKEGRKGSLDNFPNPNFGYFSEPLTVVDEKGRIVLWYLPGLLSEEQKVLSSILL
jgi:hypothetical protein